MHYFFNETKMWKLINAICTSKMLLTYRMRTLLDQSHGKLVRFFFHTKRNVLVLPLKKRKQQKNKRQLYVWNQITYFWICPIMYYLFYYRVTVYNVSKLFPWDRQLASKYTVWKADPVKGGLISEGILILVRSSIRLTKWLVTNFAIWIFRHFLKLFLPVNICRVEWRKNSNDQLLKIYLNKMRLCTFWYQTTFKACKENLKYACELRRFDLAKIWKLSCKVAQLKTTSEHFSVPWSLHPLGKPLLKSIIDRCIKSGKKILLSGILLHIPIIFLNYIQKKY